METGQLFMMQAPTVAAMSATTPAASSPAATQQSAAFAEVLQAMNKDPKSLIVTAKADAGATSSVVPATAETLLKDAEKEQPDILMPQEVVLSAAGAQIALALPTTGRMPELEETVNNQVGKAGNGAETVQVGDVRVKIPLKDLLGLSPELGKTVSPEASNVEATGPSASAFEKTASAMIATPVAEQNVLQEAQKTATVSQQLDKIIPQITPEVSRAELSGATPVLERSVLTTLTAKMPTAAQNVPQSSPEIVPASQNMTQAAHAVESTTPPATPLAQKIPVQQFMEAYSRPAVTIVHTNPVATALPAAEESSITQAAVESPVGQTMATSTTGLTDAAANGNAVKTAAVAAPSIQTQEAQKAVPTPVIASMPEQVQTVDGNLRVQQAVYASANPVRQVARPADAGSELQEEQGAPQAAKTSAAKIASSVETLLPDAVKEAATATAGDESTGGGRPAPDQSVNAQFHQNLQQQIRTESTPAVNNTATSAPTGGTLAENVARQVGERLAGHEIKTGSEQIVLRLSPENLGELKVNLRMENHRLTVEIVTDNRMVRDALAQNADSLKESLAKQNIRMDSFDVSTGGNNSGMAGRGQGDWRELAQQRQNNAWMADSGYRLPAVAVAQLPPSYQAQPTHSMVDVHF